MYTPTIQIMNKERFEYIIKKTKVNPCNQYKGNLLKQISAKGNQVKINQ